MLNGIATIIDIQRRNLKSAFANRRQALVMASVLLIQDYAFVMLWAVFFRHVGSFGGWHLEDVATLFGLSFCAMGLTGLTAGGARRIAAKIVSGDLDPYLTQPCHPLPRLVMEGSSAAGAGHLACGLLLFATLGHMGAVQAIMALSAAICAAFLLSACMVICQSLAFFLPGGGKLGEQLYTMISVLAMTPQNTQGRLMKLALFSILPAGFIVILPVEIVRERMIGSFAILVPAVGAYWVMALTVFNRGLRRYTSATGWTA